MPISIFAGKDTKKSHLTKSITPKTYHEHLDGAGKYLESAGQFVTNRLGVGLDASDELLVYPVIYPPMAYVFCQLEKNGLDQEARGKALSRLERWYIAAILDRRYQQSTHDKQARDKDDILRWALGHETDCPAWLQATTISGLAAAAPGSAKGKLLRSLLNRRELRDPLTGERVGVGPSRKPSARHHIYPTRWVQHLKGWDKTKHDNNVALNIMYLEEGTNSTFLNYSPRDQVEQCINAHGDAATRERYLQHGISSVAFDILRKPEPSVEDFYNFIAEREAFFTNLLETSGFRRATEAQDEGDEGEEE
jgi:hypothetical protein